MAQISLGGGLNLTFDRRGTDNVMEIETQAATRFYREVAIKKAAFTDNEFGLYSIGQFGPIRRMNFASLEGPKHVLSSRKSGCQWNPKGTIKTNSQSFDGFPVEYQGEQCPDALYGESWESIFGPGNNVRDLLATEQGRMLANEIIDLVYLGIGNSTHDLARWGQHPLIEEAAANNWYTVEDDEYDDYLDQQSAVPGYMPAIDALKAQGVPNYNIPFDSAWLSSAGDFVGNAHTAIDRVLNNLPTKMKLYAKRPQNGQRVRPLIIKVTPQIFDKYENEMIENHGQISQTFVYKYNGEFAASAGFPIGEQMPGVLKHKGHYIVSDDDQEFFNEMTGTKTHRITAYMPSVIGIGFDVVAAGQFRGMGMRVVQRTEAPYMGKMFMDTTFILGTGILNTEFIANSSITLTPSS